jgi:hypothetical protein
MTSFKFRTLSLVAAWSALPTMITLKAVQVHREVVLAGKAIPGFDEQIGRRLDDPSFWAMVATAIAVALINRAFQLSEGIGKSIQATTRNYIIWAVTASLCVSAYVIAMSSRGETFFFAFEVNPAEPFLHKDVLMLSIQFVEGLVNIAVIAIATAFLPIGLLLLHAVSPDKEAKPCSVPLAQKRIAALLATAGLAPVSCALVVGFEQNLFRKVFKLAPPEDWFSPWSKWSGAFAMLFLLWPFLVLMGATLWKCARSCCLCLGYRRFSELVEAPKGFSKFLADCIGIVGGIAYFYPAEWPSENSFQNK